MSSRSGTVTCRVPPVTLPDFENLLATLVGLPSISSPLSDWDQSNELVIRQLASWFSKVGFAVEVLPVPFVAGKYNLLATLGEGNSGLVLSGHTDTVPFDQQKWQQDPFKLHSDSQRWYGLGTCDMKGFFPIIIEALRALEGAELKQPIIVLATADEESSMSGARAIAQTKMGLGRAAVIGEPTSLRPIRMHKGIMMQAIRITGRSGHSSNPALGNNAIDTLYCVIGELMKLRQEMQARYAHDGFEVAGPSMNFGHVHGGDSPNRICGHCELSIDVRPVPGMDLDEIRETIKQRLDNLAAERKIRIDIEELFGGIPAFEQSKHSELVSVCEKLSGLESGSVAFATEAPYLQGLGLETMVMGAGSIDQAHQPNEYLAENQVGPMAKTLVGLINHYCLQQAVA